MSQRWKRILSKLENNEVVLLDGGVGSVAVNWHNDRPKEVLPWSVGVLANMPMKLSKIHSDYIAAGCDIITANAFRTDRKSVGERLQDYFIDVMGMKSYEKMISQLAVDWANICKPLTGMALLAAMKARDDSDRRQDVLIAGNITTVHDCYEPHLVPEDETELVDDHHEKIANLLQFDELDFDLLLIETVNTLREARVAALQALSAPRTMPVWVSLILDREPIDGAPVRLYRKKNQSSVSDPHSGELLSEAIRGLMELRGNDGNAIDAILFNCTTPVAISAALKEMRNNGLTAELRQEKIYIGAYANAQDVDQETGNWERREENHEDWYADFVLEWVELGAQIVGGCCGTRPEDIKAIKSRLVAAQQ